MQNDNKSPLCNTDYTADLYIMQENAKFVKKCMIFTIPYWRNKKGRLVPSLIIGYVKWIYLKFLPIVVHSLSL